MTFLYTQPNLPLAFGAILIVLGLATMTYTLLVWRNPDRGNLPKIGHRIRFLWLVAGFLAVGILYSRNLLLFFIAFLAFLAFKEFLSITPTRRADRRVLFWAYLAIPGQFFLIWLGWYTAFIAFIPIYVFFFLPLMMVLLSKPQGFLTAGSTLSWGIVTTVYSLGHLAFLLVLPPEGNVTGGGGLLLYLLILTQLSDVSQFFFGRLFNQPRLRLAVSTTRTWGSLFGSMITSAIIAWLAAPLITPLTPIESIIVGIIIALASFIGYITLSAIKIDLHLKDRGSMSFGHGGVLNRMDSIIYTAPLYFHLVVYLHY